MGSIGCAYRTLVWAPPQELGQSAQRSLALAAVVWGATPPAPRRAVEPSTPASGLVSKASEAGRLHPRLPPPAAPLPGDELEVGPGGVTGFRPGTSSVASRLCPLGLWAGRAGFRRAELLCGERWVLGGS